MTTQIDTPSAGFITLTDDYDPARVEVIDTTGMSEEDIAAAEAAFYALTNWPTVTRAIVLAKMSEVLGFTVADLTSFFDGSMN